MSRMHRKKLRLAQQVVAKASLQLAPPPFLQRVLQREVSSLRHRPCYFPVQHRQARWSDTGLLTQYYTQPCTTAIYLHFRCAVYYLYNIM